MFVCVFLLIGVLYVYGLKRADTYCDEDAHPMCRDYQFCLHNYSNRFQLIQFDMFEGRWRNVTILLLFSLFFFLKIIFYIYLTINHCSWYQILFVKPKVYTLMRTDALVLICSRGRARETMQRWWRTATFSGCLAALWRHSIDTSRQMRCFAIVLASRGGCASRSRRICLIWCRRRVPRQ